MFYLQRPAKKANTFVPSPRTCVSNETDHSHLLHMYGVSPQICSSPQNIRCGVEGSSWSPSTSEEECQMIFLHPLVFGKRVRIPCDAEIEASFICQNKTASELSDGVLKGVNFTEEIYRKSRKVCPPQFVARSHYCVNIYSISINSSQPQEINVSHICTEEGGQISSLREVQKTFERLPACEHRDGYWCLKRTVQNIRPKYKTVPFDYEKDVLYADDSNHTVCKMVNVFFMAFIEVKVDLKEIPNKISCSNVSSESLTNVHHDHFKLKREALELSYFAVCQAEFSDLYEFNCDRLKPYFLDENNACVSAMYTSKPQGQRKMPVISSLICKGNADVPLTALCDGVPNCDGGRDERYCSETNIVQQYVNRTSPLARGMDFYNEAERNLILYRTREDMDCVVDGSLYCLRTACVPIFYICVYSEASFKWCPGNIIIFFFYISYALFLMRQKNYYFTIVSTVTVIC